MTTSMSDHQGNQNKLQRLGLELVSDLHMYIRSLQLYKADNKIFLRPLNRLEASINGLVARDGKMHLYGASSTLYLNEEMLRFKVAFLDNANFLIETFANQNIGGLLVEKSINQQQLQDFLVRFSKPENRPPKLRRTDIQQENLALVAARLREVSAKEVDHLKSVKADVRSYAFLLYHRLFLYVSKMLDPTREQPPPNKRAVRALQELIDLMAHHEFDFLGFSDDLNPEAYEAYHICNVTIFGLMFGKHLGLRRLQMLDLGQAALRYNIGKREVDEKILRKTKPLTSEEYQECKRIPLYSARQILKGPFSWERLRHAIIAANIHQPIKSSLDPTSPTEPKGPWLYSRVLRLCSTFDSLCTRRPFRPSRPAAEALLFMQKRLHEEFDPYLLARFIRLFGSMSIKALHKELDPFDIPDDQRDTLEDLVSVMGEGMENEIDEYWQLFRLPFRTDDEEERLVFLANFIDATRIGDMEDTLQGGVKTVRFG